MMSGGRVKAWHPPAEAISPSIPGPCQRIGGCAVKVAVTGARSGGAGGEGDGPGIGGRADPDAASTCGGVNLAALERFVIVNGAVIHGGNPARTGDLERDQRLGAADAVSVGVGDYYLNGGDIVVVVRHFESTPGGIGECGLIGPGGIAAGEQTVAVELLAAAHHNLAGGGLNRGDDGQQENENPAIA
jgi:hypothetical protein